MARCKRIEGISPAEKAVIDLMVYGKSNRDIAQVLGLSPLTVKGHIQRICLKMNAENRTQVVAKYLAPHLFHRNETQ
jgi:DNA-binding CsgD family transcriptional regulator